MSRAWHWLVGNRAQPGLGGASLWSRCGRVQSPRRARTDWARARRQPRFQGNAGPPGPAAARLAPTPLRARAFGKLGVRPSRLLRAPRAPPARRSVNPSPPPRPRQPQWEPTRVCWTWVNPLIARGWTGELGEDDARFLVPPGDEVEPLAAAFDAEYRSVKQARGGAAAAVGGRPGALGARASCASSCAWGGPGGYEAGARSCVGAPLGAGVL